MERERGQQLAACSLQLTPLSLTLSLPRSLRLPTQILPKDLWGDLGDEEALYTSVATLGEEGSGDVELAARATSRGRDGGLRRAPSSEIPRRDAVKASTVEKARLLRATPLRSGGEEPKGNGNGKT